MSAPTTHDPLVVNTADGAVWQRRAVTADGRGLYAVTGSCSCPEYLMATLPELAAHGIVGQADALPMPVGPAQQPSEPRPRTMLDRGRDALNARMSKDDLRLVLENVITYAASLEARVSGLESERHVTNEALDDAVKALRASKDQPAPMYVSRPLPPRDAVCAKPECGHSGLHHRHADTACWARLPKQGGGPIRLCMCTSFVAERGA
ncbi:hypothetical protein [Streptomyces sp. NPDC048200]|uniref:hypothetical protein n=1 Tax=Streptomyces sp. NPDC048200 TaxID=3365512 RepID=UPI003711BE6E